MGKGNDVVGTFISCPEIGFFHNNSGEWDPHVSEQLDTDADAFFAMQDVYAQRTVELDDTKFAELSVGQ